MRYLKFWSKFLNKNELRAVRRYVDFEQFLGMLEADIKQNTSLYPSGQAHANFYKVARERFEQHRINTVSALMLQHGIKQGQQTSIDLNTGEIIIV